MIKYQDLLLIFEKSLLFYMREEFLALFVYYYADPISKDRPYEARL